MLTPPGAGRWRSVGSLDANIADLKHIHRHIVHLFRNQGFGRQGGQGQLVADHDHDTDFLSLD
jgi:hypothetical protein